MKVKKCFLKILVVTGVLLVGCGPSAEQTRAIAREEAEAAAKRSEQRTRQYEVDRENWLTCQRNLKKIGTALELDSTDHQGRYPTDPSHIDPQYLAQIPTCPTGSSYYIITTGGEHPGNDTYTMVCSAQHPGFEGPTGYPQYTGLEGLILPSPPAQPAEATPGLSK